MPSFLAFSCKSDTSLKILQIKRKKSVVSIAWFQGFFLWIERARMPEGHRFSPEGTARKSLRVICSCRIAQADARGQTSCLCFTYCRLRFAFRTVVNWYRVFIFPLRIGRITREVNLDKISFKDLFHAMFTWPRRTHHGRLISCL